MKSVSCTFRLPFPPSQSSAPAMSVTGKYKVLGHLRDLRDHLGVLRWGVLGTFFKHLGAGRKRMALKALIRKVPVRGEDNIIEQLKFIEILLHARHV